MVCLQPIIIRRYTDHPIGTHPHQNVQTKNLKKIGEKLLPSETAIVGGMLDQFAMRYVLLVVHDHVKSMHEHQTG